MRTRVLLAVLVVCLSVAVPTAAVATQQDDAGPVTLAPHEGPNGGYASVEDGELRVDFERLNEDANTTAHDVFTITGSADEPVRVWVEVDIDDGVTAYRGEDPSETLGTEADAPRLADGESVAVGFRIDTFGATPESGTVTVHAVPVSELSGSGGGDGDISTEDADGGDSVGGSGGAGGAPATGPPDGTPTPEPGTEEATETGTATPQTGPALRVVDVRLPRSRVLPGGTVTAVATVRNGGDSTDTRTVPLTVNGERVAADQVTVPPGETRTVRLRHTFDAPGRYAVRVDDVPAGRVRVERPGAVTVVGPDGEPVPDPEVTDVEGLPDDGPPAAPRASVRVVDGTTRTTADGTPVIRRGRTVTLTGAGTTVGTASAIAPDRGAVRVVDLAVPDSAADGGTVRIHVDRDAFEAASGAGPPRVVRFTGGDWSLLPTRVVDRSADTVVVAATLDGDGVLAVVPDGDVQFDWSLPSGATDSMRVRTEPTVVGTQNITLTVTDATGRTDTVTRRLVINDRPTVSVEQSGIEASEGRTTLRANVSDDVGDVTVTWTLPNGTVIQGGEVTGRFDPGAVVRVAVQDEFGARRSVRWTVQPGSAPSEGSLPGDLSPPAPFGLSSPTLGALGVGVSLTALLAWWRIGGSAPVGLTLFGLVRVARGRSPRASVSGPTTWNPATNVLTVGGLTVEAGAAPLERIEVVVTDERGRELVRRTVDGNGRRGYHVSRETVRLPPGVDIDPSGTYRVEVRAVDTLDRSGSYTGAADRLAQATGGRSSRAGFPGDD